MPIQAIQWLVRDPSRRFLFYEGSTLINSRINSVQSEQNFRDRCISHSSTLIYLLTEKLHNAGFLVHLHKKLIKRGYPNDRLIEMKSSNFKKCIPRLATILVPLKKVLAYPWDPSYDEEEVEEIHIDQMVHHLGEKHFL